MNDASTPHKEYYQLAYNETKREIYLDDSCIGNTG
uniref:Uncharacterized protein n=1 Tax=Arundo donax TaxID=35708 RepID=A0A0A9ESZ9_ARUDO